MKISVRNIQKNYRKKEVLKDISIDAQSGSRIGILGRNGCGKSTLLSILAGSLKADGGHFLLSDDSRPGTPDLLSSPRLRASLVGYVPQTPPLFEELTALDNLRLWYAGSGQDPARKDPDGPVCLLGVDEYLRLPVRKMSGGMKKRLSIACALARRPKILLLDEPGAALDLVCRNTIDRYLRTFCREGGIVITATHEIPEITACTDTWILREGTLHSCRYDGDIETLASRL